MASKYRLLHVIDHLGSGGSQESVVNLVKYHRRELFQPEVATLHGFGHYWEVLRSYDIPLYSLAPRWYRRAAIPLIVARLFRLMAQNRYDIVHGHTYGPNVLATTVAALCRVPLRINHNRTHNQCGRGYNRRSRISIFTEMTSRYLFLRTSAWRWKLESGGCA